MKPGLTTVLALACVFLSAIVVLEWYYTKHSNKRLFAGFTTNERESAYHAAELPTIEPSLQSEEVFADLIDRPLFIEGRRPVPESEGDTTETESAPEGFDWQLVGVYTQQGKLMALLSRTQKIEGKANYLKLAVGDEVGGWKLAEIEPDKVLLELEGRKRDLMLRKPKPTQLPPQPKAPLTPPPPSTPPKNPFLEHKLDDKNA
ncbi:MAG: hypothetical protein Kow0065_12120 [Methylomicrobium sp.]